MKLDFKEKKYNIKVVVKNNMSSINNVFIKEFKDLNYDNFFEQILFLKEEFGSPEKITEFVFWDFVYCSMKVSFFVNNKLVMLSRRYFF
tara:strand:+ start:605 stop:871 length:267 start_codon:yes stop_codon:yes gene_type:complete